MEQKASLLRRFLDALRGKSVAVERATLARLGEYPDILDAHRRMVEAQHDFYYALKGVVEANERRG